MNDSSSYPSKVESCDPSYKFWRVYRKHRGTDYVIRSGLGLCGCYPYEPGVKNFGRDEAVSQHTLGTMHMMYLLSLFFPYLFTKNHEPPRNAEERNLVQLRVLRLMVLLMYHDAGETLDDLGDQADDGSQNREVKDQLELDFISDLVRGFPYEARRAIREDFAQFQAPLDQEINDDSTAFYREMIQIARLCDKIDAILNSICYEAAGHGGKLGHKLSHYGSITYQDRRFIEVAEGDDSVPATWAAHIITEYHEFFGFKELMSVVRAGIREVRGEWFPWWSRCCANLNIPDYGWNS